MKVSASILKSDLFYSGWALYPKLKSSYFLMLFMVIATAITNFFIYGQPQNFNEWINLFGKAVLIYLIFLFVIAVIGLICISLNITNLVPGKGYYNYQITQDGLTENTEGGEGLIKWDGIESIYITNSYIFFKLPGHMMHIIPKRSFETPEQCAKFIEFSKSFWQVSNKPK
ncbi:YcxB family protein [uncultured Kiloniella sp.]|uniref:YcxB family protein n=1 Tax=uncultured Kiloniella sp. TaxID=1133091 RepID=UPI002634AB5B|nr:YcxB family protein [uncultured Kiloniella sp.]